MTQAEESRTTPRYALVILLPRDIEIRLEDAFLALLGISKPVPGYHVTLVGPFSWSAAPDEALRRIAQVCARWRPFEIRLDGMGSFRTENRNAVYVRVFSRVLKRLHRALSEALGSFVVLESPGTRDGFIPHVTLGLGLTDDELKEAITRLQRIALNERFTVTELHLLEERPQTPWRSIRTFPLSSGGEPRQTNAY